MSDIVDFYIRDGADHKGRTLVEMQAYSDDEMEGGHDFIQWMFPLHEKSYHAKYSPVLTREDIAELQSSRYAQENMRRSLFRFCEFLGLTVPRDQKKIAWWCQNGNHNLLRITRIIRSLRLFGLEPEALAFYDVITSLGRKSRGLGETSFGYWRRAMEDNVTKSLTDDFLKSKEIRIK
jgi:hypothetical protein